MEALPCIEQPWEAIHHSLNGLSIEEPILPPGNSGLALPFETHNFYRNYQTKAPIHEAAAGGFPDSVELLIRAGAPVSSTKTNAWTPLMYACNHGHIKVACILLEAGSPVDERNKEGATALYICSRSGHPDCCRVLLENSANPSAPTKNRRTPLHWYLDFT